MAKEIAPSALISRLEHLIGLIETGIEHRKLPRHNFYGICSICYPILNAEPLLDMAKRILALEARDGI